MARDANDGRVTFTGLAREYGLSLYQTKALWRSIHPPYPEAPDLGSSATSVDGVASSHDDHS